MYVRVCVYVSSFRGCVESWAEEGQFLAPKVVVEGSRRVHSLFMDDENGILLVCADSFVILVSTEVCFLLLLFYSVAAQSLCISFSPAPHFSVRLFLSSYFFLIARASTWPARGPLL